MTKLILTLAALATLGAMTLAPTDASAAGKNNHLRRAAAHPVNVRNNFHIRIQLGARPGWRRHVVHAPAHFGYRPVWRRAGYRPVGYVAPVAVVAPNAGAPAPAQPVMQAEVTGLNVAMVAVPDGQFTMTGQGQWTRQVNDGKTFQFAEVGRDASSVTLNDASRGIKVILDLSQRKVLLVASNGTTRPIFRIVNAAAK